MTAERAVRDVSDDAIVAALRAVADIYVQGQKHHVRVKMGSILNRVGWSRDSVERFGYALCATFGGDNADKIAGETVRGMAYPSGYYDLVAMAPPGRRGITHDPYVRYAEFSSSCQPVHWLPDRPLPGKKAKARTTSPSR